MTDQTAIQILGEPNGLRFLTEKFSRLQEIPSLPDICGWLAEAEITEDEILPYRHFNFEKYARNRIFSNDFVEMLILAWLPGQDTLIHDHNGSHGVVRIFEGTITETKYKFDESGTIQVNAKQAVPAGTLAGVGEPDIHKLGNESDKGAISIHVYAPPLKGMNIYEVGSSESWLYQPE
ncbi:MAG: cysteine dioxygenase family protein [Pyrinomonadaceae bacterium]|nr:cysteine dioxygenase family protein [Pyrinomonadaceae bacterium]